MGTLIGNLLALAVIVISAAFGLVSLEASSVIFIAAAYLLWGLILSIHVILRPNKLDASLLLLSDEKGQAYLQYHIHLRAPGAGDVFSAFMNGLRMAGFVWGGLCFWNGLYWLGGLAVFYFFLSGPLILKLNPWLYMSAQAKKGNGFAINQLSLISSVQERLKVLNNMSQI